MIVFILNLRRSKYPNSIIEQDHRAVKQITDPMLGFKTFWSTQKLTAGIETVHMVKKGQLDCPKGQLVSAAAPFYSLKLQIALQKAVYLIGTQKCDTGKLYFQRQLPHSSLAI
jgi:hypothetical protein